MSRQEWTHREPSDRAFQGALQEGFIRSATNSALLQTLVPLQQHRHTSKALKLAASHGVEVVSLHPSSARPGARTVAAASCSFSGAHAACALRTAELGNWSKRQILYYTFRLLCNLEPVLQLEQPRTETKLGKRSAPARLGSPADRRMSAR